MTPASELNLREMLTQQRHRIHLIGVAGSGMSGIAALLLELGHDVSGSDKVASWEVNRLQRLGLRFRGINQEEVVRLGLSTGLTAYDASYLWLSRVLGMPLVTLDRKLGAHAKNL